jgi:hypothetical protein
MLQGEGDRAASRRSIISKVAMGRVQVFFPWRVGVYRPHQNGDAARARGDECGAFGGVAGRSDESDFLPGYEGSDTYGIGAPKDTSADIRTEPNKWVEGAWIGGSAWVTWVG